MTVDYPWLLLLALLLPALVVGALVRADRRRRARLDRLGDHPVVRRLMPGEGAHASGWRTARLAGACALIGVALAGPRWGTEASVQRRRGIDMVLALDASLSMEATDAKPTRLAQMKQEVRRLRALSPGDRIGLIVFAGRAYVLSPLTVDESALDLFLDNLDPSIVGQAGSSLSSAIRQGTDLLSLDNGRADRALVVMSDGEAFEPLADVTDAARRAGEKGISLVTVGFGTTQGSTIPIRAPDGSMTLKRDQNGQIVVTHYTPQTLDAAAQAAHGTFIPASATDKAARVRQALSTLRTAEHAAENGEGRTPRFQLFLFPAVLLLLLDGFLADRRSGAGREAPAAASGLAALLLVGVLGGCAGAGESRDAARAYQAGQYAEALALFRGAIEHGDQRPRTIYDFGTAYLAVDSVQNATDAFDRVVDLPDPELRYRALFNRGLAHLRRGLAAKTGGGDDLDAALADYKKTLILRPGDLDAKWNYELALHARKERGGGGGGGGASDNASQAPSPQAQAPTPSGGLGLNQAEQILASAAREERDVQAQQLRRRQQAVPPNGKDW
ncbi:MAG: VWA domain-containing protein [Gemmatimonadota bacterium]|nr:VWA domain-containing protein [Gemmatimonadota bacterium]MDE3216579.1 VWA domain-containing protein [Gemmatimonadota bacterium]